MLYATSVYHLYTKTYLFFFFFFERLKIENMQVTSEVVNHQIDK